MARPITRRTAIGALLGASSIACSKKPEPAPSRVESVRTNGRLPVVYLPHGGGPWPFMEPGGFADPREHEALAGYLTALPAQLPVKPRALVVVSAHWEEPVPTVMTSARPPMLYDYSGFPPETYRITWPAPGAPDVAARVRALLGSAGIGSAEDAARGFDHGTFVPLKVSYPAADVPTVQLSLVDGLDPAKHLAIGRALAPLRDEGIFLVGSGMSFHNLRNYRRAAGHSVVFDRWLQDAVTGANRDAELTRWAEAPSARQAHPREEHLLPLMVIAGAAGADRGRIAWSDTFGGSRVTAVHFG